MVKEVVAEAVVEPVGAPVRAETLPDQLQNPRCPRRNRPMQG